MRTRSGRVVGGSAAEEDDTPTPEQIQAAKKQLEAWAAGRDERMKNKEFYKTGHFERSLRIEESPLSAAARAADLRAVKVFLAAGADPNVSDSCYEIKVSINWEPKAVWIDKAPTPPLAIACSAGHVEVAKVLIAGGADPEKESALNGFFDDTYKPYEIARRKCDAAFVLWLETKAFEQRLQRAREARQRQTIDEFECRNIARVYIEGRLAEKDPAEAAQWLIAGLERARLKPDSFKHSDPYCFEALQKLRDEGEPLAVAWFAEGKAAIFLDAQEVRAKARAEEEERKRLQTEKEEAEQAVIDAGFAILRAHEVERCKRAFEETGIKPSSGYCADTRCELQDYCTFSHGWSDLPPHCRFGRRCPHGLFCVYNHLPDKRLISRKAEILNKHRKSSNFGTYKGPQDDPKELVIVDDEGTRGPNSMDRDGVVEMVDAFAEKEMVKDEADEAVDAFLATNTADPQRAQILVDDFDYSLESADENVSDEESWK